MDNKIFLIIQYYSFKFVLQNSMMVRLTKINFSGKSRDLVKKKSSKFGVHELLVFSELKLVTVCLLF
jgi:hypothetical protein